MGREPEIIEGQFDVADGSTKAGAETVRKPGVLLPTIMAILMAVGLAQRLEPEHDVLSRYFFAIYLAFVWPFWRMVQLAIRALRSKVSERDADRLAERFPTRAQRRSKV